MLPCQASQTLALFQISGNDELPHCRHRNSKHCFSKLWAFRPLQGGGTPLLLKVTLHAAPTNWPQSVTTWIPALGGVPGISPNQDSQVSYWRIHQPANPLAGNYPPAQPARGNLLLAISHRPCPPRACSHDLTSLHPRCLPDPWQP